MSLVLKSVLPHKNALTSFWEYTLTLLHFKIVDHIQLSTCCSSPGQTWKFSFACRRNVTLRRRKTCCCLTQRDCGGKAERGSKGELREKTWLGWTLRPTLVGDIQSMVLGLPLGQHCSLGPNATCSICKLSFRLLWEQTELHWGPGPGRNFHGNDSCQIVSVPQLNLCPPIQGPGCVFLCRHEEPLV